ncbi:MAG: NTP transferase domain-containing protein [Bacteroidia bacterium]|nr:NTP transferase domain-containing protein [Bacteroidia bacterium]
MNNNQTIHAYILAGGKSSRMGSDKGLLLLGDKKIVELVIEQVKPLVQKLVIVSNNPEYQQFGLEVIPDVIKDAGPAGGIHAALAHSKADKLVILSCDMPFVSTAAIASLLENTIDKDIVVPVFKKKLEPMLSVYSTNCRAKWEELLTNNTFKLQTLFSHFNTLELNVDGHPAFSDRLFSNINTVEDLQKALGNRNPEIKILVFGQLSELVNATELSWHSAQNTNELINQLQQRFPLLAVINYRVAVNKKINQNSVQISDGDTVALLPPFSGG